jgi:hypothetical protein
MRGTGFYDIEIYCMRILYLIQRLAMISYGTLRRASRSHKPAAGTLEIFVSQIIMVDYGFESDLYKTQRSLTASVIAHACILSIPSACLVAAVGRVRVSSKVTQDNTALSRSR